MLCQDLLSIREFQEIKLLAGEKGLGRNIRWLYFADSLECTDQEDDPENWVHNGELFVLTNNRMLRDVPKVLTLMKKAFAMDAAGFIINVGNQEEAYINLCNDLSFPLFEIPWSVKLVDLSQNICTRLIQETMLESTLEHLLGSILYADFESEEDIVNKALYYGVDLRQACRIAVFSSRDYGSPVDRPAGDHDEKTNRNIDSLHRIVRFEYKMHGFREVMSLIREEAVLVLFPADDLDERGLENISENVQEKMAANQPDIHIQVGIGNAYQQVGQMKKSYFEAAKAVNLIEVMGNRSNLLYFQNTGMYSLLFLINDKDALQKYHAGILGKLEEYDRMNHTELCASLEIYLRQSSNTGLAAEQLFIHRNTLRYRLDKIQAILEMDLENVDNIVNLSIAFHVRRYLAIMN